MTLADNSDRTYHLIVTHTCGRLDTDDIVGTLVAHQLVRRDIHELDVLRHDNMRRHLLIDQDDMLGVITGEVITVKMAPDIPHLHRVRVGAVAADLRCGRQA